MWYTSLIIFGLGAVVGGFMTACFTYYFLNKYEAEEQEPEVIDITVPVPEPIVDNSPEFDVWKPF